MIFVDLAILSNVDAKFDGLSEENSMIVRPVDHQITASRVPLGNSMRYVLQYVARVPAEESVAV